MSKSGGYLAARILQRDRRFELEITIPPIIKSRLRRISERAVRRISQPMLVNKQRMFYAVVYV